MSAGQDRWPGFLPDGVRPESEPIASAMISEATDRGLPVVIHGSDSHAGWLPARPLPALDLSTAALAGQGDLRQDNLSATFAAGTPLSDVQTQVAAAGLWFPIMHPEAPKATLGGCVAVGVNDPLRLGFGPLRDWILGLTLVGGRGQVLPLGGQVLKNVAGYDLVRLQIGAWGRFGLITRVVLRLLPLPEDDVTVKVCFGTCAEADAATDRALAGRARPDALEVSTSNENGIQMLARVVGDAPGVVCRADALQHALGTGAEVLTGSAGHAAWTALDGWCAGTPAGYPWELSLALPTPALADCMALLAPTLGLLQRWHLMGHAGGRFFTLYWEGFDDPLPVLDRLRYLRASRTPPASRPSEGSHGVASPLGAFAIRAEGCAARFLCDRPSPGWVSFPPRDAKGSDDLEQAVIAALAPGRPFNPHLP